MKNVPFAMNKKNGIGESKPKQSRRQGESAPEIPVGRAYAVGSLAVGKVLKIFLYRIRKRMLLFVGKGAPRGCFNEIFVKQ